MGRQSDVVALGTISSAWGNAVRDTGVIWFADAAQRTSQWPSPHEGAVSYLQDTNSYESWNGSAWVSFGGGGAPSGPAGGVLGGTYPNPSFAVDMATQAELDAEAALARNANNLTSGTVADVRIASTIARDSEVATAITNSEAGQVRDGDAAGGDLSGTYPNPDVVNDSHSHTAATLPGTTLYSSAIGSTVQGFDATLSALAGLATGVDKAPYSTGTDAFAQYDISGRGRMFAGMVNGSFDGGSGNGTVTATTIVLAQTGTMSAPRTVALPAASAYPTNIPLIIVDESGSVTTTNTITVNRAGSDTIDGATSFVINAAYGFVVLESNGSNKWTVIAQTTKALVQGAGVLLTEGASSVTADVIGVNVQAFSTAGTATWTKPANALRCFCRVIGSGTGGGSGRCGAAGSDRFGGGGGGAGGIREAWLPASALAATETITVAAGGNGGAAVGPAAANGNSGGVGANSTIGSILGGGAGGAFGSGGGGGTAAATAGAPGSLLTDRFTSAFGPLFVTPTGGDSSITASGVAGGGGFTRTPAAGGGGGGVSTANVERAGGAGGSSYPGTDSGNVLNGGNGGAVRTNGSQGTACADMAYQHGAGGGGGGGSNSSAVNGGNGAAGRQPGGGGGGGGATTSGGTAVSGAGGAGGDGYVLIVTLLGSGS